MSRGPLHIGIVGSRRRNTLRDRNFVLNIVKSLITENSGREIVLVSGACQKGADAFAAEAARIFNLRIIEHKIPDRDYDHIGEFVKEAYARNRLIVIDSHIIFALCSPDRTGGTENTIKHAEELKKRTFLVDESGEHLLIVDGPNPCDVENQPD